jgi:hypothetical protein
MVMVSLFRQFSVWSCGILLASYGLQVCAESGPGFSYESDVNRAYDEVIAYVPHQQAETPAVALAKINIALYRARQVTEERLCNGKWTPRGILQYQQGPETAATLAGEQTHNNKSWFFQSFRNPGTLVCPNITRAEYFMEMSRHLPAWISVRPAGQATIFRLGQAFIDGQHSLAVR